MTYPAQQPGFQPPPQAPYGQAPAPKKKPWVPILIIGLVLLAIAVPTCVLLGIGAAIVSAEDDAPPPSVASGSSKADESGIVTLAVHGAPRSIAVDKEAVYWTDTATGSVFKVAKAGGAVTKLSERAKSQPRLVRVDDDNVYWFEHAQKFRNVMKIPKAGGEAKRLTGAFDVGCIAIDPGSEKDGRLFWLWASDPHDDRDEARVLQRPMEPPNVPKSGGETKGWGGSGRPARCVAIDKDNVFYVGRELGDAPSYGLLVKRSYFNIYRVYREGGEYQRIGNGACDFLELDETEVYCGERGRISRVHQEGGEQTVLFEDDSRDSFVSGMAIDESHVYFSHTGDKEGAVLRVNNKNGGTPETIAKGEYRPSHVAVDEAHVYWINEGSKYGMRGGSVRKKKK